MVRHRDLIRGVQPSTFDEYAFATTQIVVCRIQEG